MRIPILILLLLLMVLPVAAQNKTIVLVRHAEKAAETAATAGNPGLSDEGRQRASRLMEFARKYKPHEIFATNYKRVTETVEPTARFRRKQVQIYDPKEPQKLVDQIMASKTEHYLIAGHSNTIPPLANLLAGKEVFRNLPEGEFGVIWVVKIRNGKLKRVEVYAY
jgi:2,3-bisphosphoglycerate-dependent phosphoglycerate mutase